MRIIEIEEDKIDKLSDCAEKMLRYGGKLMECLEEISERGSMGQREDDWDDDEMGQRGGYGGGYGGGRGGSMGQRRGVKYTGRYSRYR